MKFIYILGRGHSGTTMLDLVIGRSLGFRSCGELISGLSRYPSQRCTCGLMMEQCETWQAAIEALDIAVEDRPTFFKYLASKASIFKLLSAVFHKWDPVYRRALSKEADFIRAAQGDYKGVIDSSKELTRGVALARGPAKAIWLHIYRKPEQISASYRFRARKGKVKIFRKLYMFPPHLLFLLDIFVAITWSVWTFLTILIGCILPNRYICIKYEAFLESPAKHISVIADSIGESVSLATIEERIAAKINVGHIVGGNRMSQEGSFFLKSSSTTQRAIPLSSKVICFLLCAPVKLMAFLAYKASFKPMYRKGSVS